MLQALLCLVCAIGLDSELDSDPKDLSPVTDEVAEILTKWEAASNDAKKHKIEFHRTVYNFVFQTEARGEGELFCQMPHDVRLIVRPAPLPKKPVVRVGLNAPFRLEPDRGMQLAWSSNQLVIVDDDGKTYQRFEGGKNEPPLPEIGELDVAHSSELVETKRSFARRFHVDVILPFLISIKADNARSLWSFQVSKRDEKQIFLVATPRARLSKQTCHQCRILIDADKWQTKSIKIIDPSQNLETVYVVKDRKLNPELPADSFSPDLKSLGYKDLSNQDTPAKQSPVKQLTD